MHILEEDVDEGTSAAKTRHIQYHHLWRGVWPGMRHLGCMWVFDEDDLPMCGAKVAWTYGSDAGAKPRVFCDEHAGRLLSYIRKRREQELEFDQRHREIQRAAQEAEAETLDDAQVQAILALLEKSGDRPCLWLIAGRTGVRARVVYDIAKGAGLRTSTSYRADGIRDDILSNKFSFGEIARRYKIKVHTVRYHAKMLGVRRASTWRKA